MLNGEDVSDLSPQQRRKRGMARSFQRTNIFPDLTVEQQLRVASWAVADADIAEVMNELNLAALANRPAGDISYGDQRRLDLALALVGRPQVLLLDEPAAGLTMDESLALARTLRDLVNRWNVTVLLGRTRHAGRVHAFAIGSPCCISAASSAKAPARRSGPIRP